MADLSLSVCFVVNVDAKKTKKQKCRVKKMSRQKNVAEEWTFCPLFYHP